MFYVAFWGSFSHILLVAHAIKKLHVYVKHPGTRVGTQYRCTVSQLCRNILGSSFIYSMTGQNGIRTKWHWRKWYGKNGTDKMVRTKWYGQNGIRTKWY